MFSETFFSSAQATNEEEAFRIAKTHASKSQGVLGEQGGVAKKEAFVLLDLPSQFDVADETFIDDLITHVATVQPFKDLYRSIHGPAIAFKVNTMLLPQIKASDKLLTVSTPVKEPVIHKTAYRVRGVNDEPISPEHPDCKVFYDKEKAFKHAKTWAVRHAKRMVVEIVSVVDSQEPIILRVTPQLEHTGESIEAHTYVFLGTSKI